jgi:hypothetical protein
VRPSGVLIMRKLWKPADARTYAEYAFRPVPEPVRGTYPVRFASGPGIFGICEWYLLKSGPKTVPNVCPLLLFVAF